MPLNYRDISHSIGNAPQVASNQTDDKQREIPIHGGLPLRTWQSQRQALACELAGHDAEPGRLQSGG